MTRAFFSPRFYYSISRNPVEPPGPGNITGVSPRKQSNKEIDKQEEAMVALLRNRIERIRAGKERLLMIERLSQLEEETKGEVLDVSMWRSRWQDGDV
jgi:hypothetical protein